MKDANHLEIEDKFERQQLIENLTRYIQSLNEADKTPFVLTINATWGRGKSWFLQNWKQYLAEIGHHPTLYFNAWENDYLGIPMVAFASELESQLKEHYPNLDTNDYKELQSFLYEIGEVASGIYAESHGVPQSIISPIQKAAKKLLFRHRRVKTHVEKFKSILESLVAQVLDNYYVEDNKYQAPLIIFIDELDRCRPTYAIELFENIKHIFSVKNIVFILGIDREQLGHSMKTVYGNEMDTSGYLRRFIDFEYNLPEPDMQEFVKVLLEKQGIAIDDANEFSIVASALSRAFPISPRDMEKIMIRVSAMYQSSEKKHYFYLLASLFYVAYDFVEKGDDPVEQARTRYTISATILTKLIPAMPDGKIRDNLILFFKFYQSTRESYKTQREHYSDKVDLTSMTSIERISFSNQELSDFLEKYHTILPIEEETLQKNYDFAQYFSQEN